MIVFRKENPKVLYITGWPGTNRGDGNIITYKYLQEVGFDVIDMIINYDTERPKDIFRRINNVIRKEGIEIVVGLSTGGLFTACLSGVQKILINPCFNIGIFLMFNPKVDLSIAKELKEMRDYIVVDYNTYGFFSNEDEVAHSKDQFIRLYGKSNCFTIKNSQHVPRSFEWNEQIIPVLRKITGLKLRKIGDIEFSKYPEKKTYAWVDGIRLPGFKFLPKPIFEFRRKYLESKGIRFDDVDFREE